MGGSAQEGRMGLCGLAPEACLEGLGRLRGSAPRRELSLRRVENGRIFHHAGSGERGCEGDGGPPIEAQFNRYGGDMDVGPGGSLYLVDDIRIRKIDPSGSTSARSSLFLHGKGD